MMVYYVKNRVTAYFIIFIAMYTWKKVIHIVLVYKAHHLRCWKHLSIHDYEM